MSDYITGHAGFVLMGGICTSRNVLALWTKATHFFIFKGRTPSGFTMKAPASQPGTD